MRVFLAASIVLAAAGHVLAEPNLLKNGSFEGGKRYWFIDSRIHRVVDNDAAHGQRAMRLDKGLVQSAAFELVQNKPVVISFSARAVEGQVTVGWQCTPAAREVGVKAGLTWGLKGKHPVKLTDQWKRYSFTFTPNVAQTGFWPRPTFMMQLGDGEAPWLLDAVTVAYDSGAEAYVPRRPIEVGVDSPDLKGYRDPSANLFDLGATVTLVGSVCNTTAQDSDVTLRWQLIDYEGSAPLSEPIDKELTLAAGKTVHETVQMKLAPKGLALGRLSVIGADGKTIDSSDLPLCSLPYPKNSTKPDPRERFGASLWGLVHGRMLQRIGMAWTRWHPHMNWADHQKDGPDSWKFFDKQLDDLESIGFSTHAVLYGKPKWAFEKDQGPLPKDMQWSGDDPKWQDLSIQTAWDKFIITAVEHYKGRSLVYEIENEPEFDGWDKYKDQYAAFTMRTARLIKQTDPKARVMVDNVYGVPSGLNHHLLKSGAGKYIDIISWHDYHDGWLADGQAMRRMRANLEALGCGHIEIWFNEGWAYTNTVVDEPAVALTNRTSAQSTNDMVCSVAELTVNGQEKTILFHTGYEDHGQSFWDYAGPGQMIWDFYEYPLPLVAAWNVVCHHLGLSDRVAHVRPVGANLAIFQDLRNAKGVMVAYVDRDAKADVVLDLPVDKLQAEDAMGNPVKLQGSKLTLSRGGRPVFLWTTDSQSGKVLAAKVAALDRRNASFVGAAGDTWKLPPVWEGAKRDSADGNPAQVGAKPVWRLDQVWPADPSKPENYRPLVWRDGWWVAIKDGFGGQPKAEMKDSAIRLEFRAPATGSPGEKLCSLSYIAPASGTYTITGQVALKLWDGDLKVRLAVLKKSAKEVAEVAALPLKRNGTSALKASAQLEAGEELVIVPRLEGMFVGGDVTLSELMVQRGDAGALAFRLPSLWEGVKQGSAEGNPLKVGDKPVWRVDQVWPDDPTIASNYVPLEWAGAAWQTHKTAVGGQPEVRVENGTFKVAVRGPWTGQPGQRIAGLVFIAPKNGVYKVSGTAFSKPWEGAAKVYKLGVFKKDTQRATQEKVYELPRDATKVKLDFTVDLAAGHELVLLPLMGDWHNATSVQIDELVIEMAK
jgi:hypothetical protein